MQYKEILALILFLIPCACMVTEWLALLSWDQSPDQTRGIVCMFSPCLRSFPTGAPLVTFANSALPFVPQDEPRAWEASLYPHQCFPSSECHALCHPKCSPCLPATCGMSSDCSLHLSEGLCRDKGSTPGQQLKEAGGHMHLEGWMKLPRFV